MLTYLASSGLSAGDLFNGSIGLFVGLGSIGAAIGLSILDRRSRKKDVSDEWKKRADELSGRLEEQHKADMRAITKDRDFWRDKWMGVQPNDRVGAARQRQPDQGVDDHTTASGDEADGVGEGAPGR